MTASAKEAVKLLASIISGIVIGVAGTLITINWQEEKLRFELSHPATFGDIVYQNLRVSNGGWNPATNVKVFLSHPEISTRNVQSSPPFNVKADEATALGGYDRIRRGEAITLAFSFKGAPITPAMLTIKSDRSMARLLLNDGPGINLGSFFLGASAWVLLLLIPAYRSLRKWMEWSKGAFWQKDTKRQEGN